MAKKIMKLEKTLLSPSGCGQAVDLQEAVSVGSWQWRQRGWLPICFKHLSCLLAAWGSITGWELFLRSWTNRTHSYSLTKCKKCSCHQQKCARIGCPALSFACQVSPPAQKAFHTLVSISPWGSPPWRPGLLSGAVLDLPHIALIIHCLHLLTPSSMESIYWST